MTDGRWWDRYGGAETNPANENTAPAVTPTTSPVTMDYRLYFGNQTSDPQLEHCAAVYWVTATGPVAADPIAQAIEQLLAGVPPRWRSDGYFSAIPLNVKLLSATQSGDTLTLNFSSELNSGGGSCAMEMRRAQIAATARAANPDVTEVIIQVEGDAETALQP